jgi:hypothetical protein
MSKEVSKMDESTKQQVADILAHSMKPRHIGRMDRDDRFFLDKLREDIKFLCVLVSELEAEQTPRSKRQPKH